MARARRDTTHGKGIRGHGRPRRRYTVTVRGDTPLDLHDRIAAVHAALIHALINTVRNRPPD